MKPYSTRKHKQKEARSLFDNLVINLAAAIKEEMKLRNPGNLADYNVLVGSIGRMEHQIAYLKDLFPENQEDC